MDIWLVAQEPCEKAKDARTPPDAVVVMLLLTSGRKYSNLTRMCCNILCWPSFIHSSRPWEVRVRHYKMRIESKDAAGSGLRI
jgi:hypothetical protein